MTQTTSEASATPDPSLGVLLFIPYRHLEQRILDAVVAAGHPITLPQARLFQRMSPEGSRLTTLAASAQTTKQAAKFLVDQLERAGSVTREADPTDARARLVVISPKGREVQRLAAREEQAIYDEWRDHLGDNDFRRLEEILGRLREVTDPYRDLDPQD